MPAKILLVNGPNLNMLGSRQPELYGRETLPQIEAKCKAFAKKLKLELDCFQSNHEGELIEAIHAARGNHDAIIINAGAFSHTSWAIHDALAAFEGKVVELHLSNPAAREPFRHTSVIAPVADGAIVGFGGLGYALAVDAAARLLTSSKHSRLKR